MEKITKNKIKQGKHFRKCQKHKNKRVLPSIGDSSPLYSLPTIGKSQDRRYQQHQSRATFLAVLFFIIIFNKKNIECALIFMFDGAHPKKKKKNFE